MCTVQLFWYIVQLPLRWPWFSWHQFDFIPLQTMLFHRINESWSRPLYHNISQSHFCIPYVVYKEVMKMLSINTDKFFLQRCLANCPFILAWSTTLYGNLGTWLTYGWSHDPTQLAWHDSMTAGIVLTALPIPSGTPLLPRSPVW